MSWEGDRQAGSLHGGLVVPQLMDPLLLQQQGLLLTHRKKNQTWPVMSHFRLWLELFLQNLLKHEQEF